VLAGGHCPLDELPLVHFVVGAAGVAKPPAQERPRCARFCLCDLDGAQFIRPEADARRL